MANTNPSIILNFLPHCVWVSPQCLMCTEFIHYHRNRFICVGLILVCGFVFIFFFLCTKSSQVHVSGVQFNRWLLFKTVSITNQRGRSILNNLYLTANSQHTELAAGEITGSSAVGPFTSTQRKPHTAPPLFPLQPSMITPPSDSYSHHTNHSPNQTQV